MTKIKHPTAATLKKWTRMTDENDHDAVRIEIANWIKENTDIHADDFLLGYREVEAEHELLGRLSTLAQYARLGADSVLDFRVRAVDPALADKIHACL